MVSGKMWYHLVLGVCVLVLSVDAQVLEKVCTTPLNKPGTCISAFKCNPLLPLLRSTTRTEDETRFLHSSRCGADPNGIPYVCCPDLEPTTEIPVIPYVENPQIPNRNTCGFQVFDRIVGGEKTNFDEFPWMAVLEYLKPNGNREFGCGGSLINRRYVLTAAHCVTLNQQLVNVRLGEYNLSSPGRDCFWKKKFEFCNDWEVNVDVSEIIIHPSYSERALYHDIALLRLAREVQYSDFIQPICLPLPTELPYPGKKMWVAGWGTTETRRYSNVKLKLELAVRAKTWCSDAFSGINVAIGEGHICAGGETGKDSCTGDSGGPLMRTTPHDGTRWMIDGVVSFGMRYCGLPGYPGVYTSVAKYVSWIHQTVRP